MNESENTHRETESGRRAVRLTLKKKLLFGAMFTVAGLVLVELTCFLLVRFLPGYDAGGIQVFRNVHNMDGERSLFMTKRMAGELDGILDNTVLFNLMGNRVTHPDPDLIFRVRPDVGEVEGIGDLTINSLGFRGPEFDLDADAAVRVMVLGDSCAFGWWIVDIDYTWTRHLERFLEGEFGETQIFNLAQPGYSSLQCSLLFDRWFKRIRPDYLIVYAGWNDLHEATITDSQTVEIMRHTMSPATMWLRRSHTYEFFEQTMMRSRVARVKAKGEMAARHRRVPAEEGVENFKRIVAKAGAAGCEVIVVMPPFSSERAPDKPDGFGNMLEYRQRIAEGVRSDALVAIFQEMEHDQPNSVHFFVEGDGYHPDTEGAVVIARGLFQAISHLRKQGASGVAPQ